MHNTLLGLVAAVVVVGAQTARADDWGHAAVPVQNTPPCGPRPEYAPVGQSTENGHYELQNVQQWVPGTQQQVWVPQQCSEGGRRHHRHRFGFRACTGGYWDTQWTAGHMETAQQWVWVSMPQRHERRSQQQYQQQYGGGFGFEVNGTNGSFSVQTY